MMQDDDFKALGIDRNPATYRMLNDSKCLTVAGHDDKKEFGIVVNAMQVLGFSHDTQQAIWRTLAGILLLGNLEFAPLSAKDSEASRVSNPELVAQIAALWDVVPANLDGALVTRTFATGVGNKSTLRKGGVNSPLNVEGAKFARDALAKALYSGLFDFVVEQLNRSMAPPAELTKRLTLGILDIYGFEIFQDNSFEQVQMAASACCVGMFVCC